MQVKTPAVIVLLQDYIKRTSADHISERQKIHESKSSVSKVLRGLEILSFECLLWFLKKMELLTIN